MPIALALIEPPFLLPRWLGAQTSTPIAESE